MKWIFSAFIIVSIIHMVEEYFYPGGIHGRYEAP